MLNDANKYFNKDNNHYANQQLIGCKDLFRGVIVIEWVIRNQSKINFHQYNKLLVKSCAQCYHEF